MENPSRTLMLQVSSVSKSTIDSPPLASSALLGGRNRATTEQDNVSPQSPLHLFPIDSHTLDGVARVPT